MNEKLKQLSAAITNRDALAKGFSTLRRFKAEKNSISLGVQQTDLFFDDEFWVEVPEEQQNELLQILIVITASKIGRADWVISKLQKQIQETRH